jgi:hypothetical protein
MDTLSLKTTVDFLEICYLFGLSFFDDGNKLQVEPAERLNDRLRFEIKQRKARILRLLKAVQADGQPCKVCNWHGRTFDGWCEVCFDPAFLAESVGDELVLVRA